MLGIFTHHTFAMMILLVVNVDCDGVSLSRNKLLLVYLHGHIEQNK